MRLSIQRIGMRLFTPLKAVLDLDTGKTYAEIVDNKVIQTLKHTRVLPCYPTTPIYQRYLKMVHERLGVVPWEGFELYPEFELLPDSKIDETSDFLKKAHHFCAGFDYVLINERVKSEPKYDPSFPVFFQFMRQFTWDFAKEWCEQEGYEWYVETYDHA